MVLKEKKTSVGKRLRLLECPPPSSTTVKVKNKEKKPTRIYKHQNHNLLKKIAINTAIKRKL